MSIGRSAVSECGANRTMSAAPGRWMTGLPVIRCSASQDSAKALAIRSNFRQRPDQRQVLFDPAGPDLFQNADRKAAPLAPVRNSIQRQQFQRFLRIAEEQVIGLGQGGFLHPGWPVLEQAAAPRQPPLGVERYPSAVRKAWRDDLAVFDLGNDVLELEPRAARNIVVEIALRKNSGRFCLQDSNAHPLSARNKSALHTQSVIF